jgi:hypothetical protein
MAELERDLRALAAHVELPAERDLWPGVQARLAPRPRRFWARPLAVALIAAAVALGIAFAVPSARSAILRFLGLEGVSIVRVEKLPAVSSNPPVVGIRTTLPVAEQLLGFEPLLLDSKVPYRAYLDPSRQALLLLYGKPLRLRLEETRLGVFEKMVTLEQRVEPVSVNGDRGIWVGGRHVLDDFFSQPRLAANTLVWKHDFVTYRLEGRFTKEQALELARSASVKAR